MTAATYLDGNFAPVATELTATDLEVTGAVPPALAGRYIRTGPNPFAADADTYHWFAGDGMVHGVDLHGGRARWYRNRWVRSPEASAHLGESPVPHEDGGWYPGSGNTNVFAHAGRILAVTEGSLPYELTGDLDTVATRNFGGPLPAGINAHPKFDPYTGEMHVMSYGFDNPALRYHVIDSSGELVSTVDIDLPAPVMLHDMGLTASRVVLFDLPVLFDLELALQGVPLPFRWRPDNGARVGLLPRAGTGADVVWIDVEPCFVYHPLNAFDDGDRVVIDLVVHDHAFAEDGEPLSDRPRLERWTIDPRARKVLTETIDDRGTEFPRGDERLMAAATATATRSAHPRCATWARWAMTLGQLCASTTSSAAPPSRWTWAPAASPARWCSSRRAARLARTTVGSWATCTTPRATPATW